MVDRFESGGAGGRIDAGAIGEVSPTRGGEIEDSVQNDDSAVSRPRLEQRKERTLQFLKRRLERNHLLILDEMGCVPFSKLGAEPHLIQRIRLSSYF